MQYFYFDIDKQDQTKPSFFEKKCVILKFSNIIYNYFKGKLREFTKGYQDQFCPHPESSKGCFVGKIGRGNPWLRKFLISQKSSCIQFYRLLRCKCANFFMKKSQSGSLYYLIVPRDVT